MTSRFVLLVSEGVGGFVGSPDPLASSWARNICQHSDTGGEEERAEGLVCSRPGPGISGAAQLGMAALFICPDLAFAPEVTGPALVKGAIVLQEKSVTNIYHEGNAKPWPAASQTRAVKFTTVHFGISHLHPSFLLTGVQIIPPHFC